MVMEWRLQLSVAQRRLAVKLSESQSGNQAMTPSSKVALIALAVSLVACAPKPYPPPNQAQLTDLSAATTPAPAPASTTPRDWVSTYPYGTAQTTGSSQGQLAVPPPSIALAEESQSEAVASQAAAPSTVVAPSAPAVDVPEPAETTQTAAHGSSGGDIPRISASEGITVIAPAEEGGQPLPAFQSGWAKQGVSQEQHRADIESCYRYAFAQVDHDLKIDSDVAAARVDDDRGLGFTMLTEKLNLYDLKRRRTELINDCMEDKGYFQS